MARVMEGGAPFESAEQLQTRRYFERALFHGGRQHEFAQLRTRDVKTYREIDDFDFFEFDAESGERADDKSLKTATSTRVVPIHPALIEVGFLDLVERRRRDGAERIFPELKWRSAGGYLTNLSRWFAALLDRLELTSRALVFHPFRHGWIDAARSRAQVGRQRSGCKVRQPAGPSDKPAPLIDSSARRFRAASGSTGGDRAPPSENAFSLMVPLQRSSAIHRGQDFQSRFRTKLGNL